MNFYVNIISNAVEFIEDSIAERLNLQIAAKKFHFSEHHFSRLFKILTGVGLKNYIMGRKLAVALDILGDKNNSVTDIAYNLGFEYPEVFSRSFKKHYGISPLEYRQGKSILNSPMEKAVVVERAVMNYQGGFALKENFVYRTDTYLTGVFTDVSENDAEFLQTLATACNAFLLHSKDDNTMKQHEFYSMVHCSGEGDGRYTVFFGKEQVQYSAKWQRLKIPGGWYADFSYYGEMSDMRLVFTDDYYHWVIAKEIDIRDNGIGMLNIYSTQDHKNVQILVPAENPKLQQK